MVVRAKLCRRADTDVAEDDKDEVDMDSLARLLHWTLVKEEEEVGIFYRLTTEHPENSSNFLL